MIFSLGILRLVARSKAASFMIIDSDSSEKLLQYIHGAEYLAYGGILTPTLPDQRVCDHGAMRAGSSVTDEELDPGHITSGVSLPLLVRQKPRARIIQRRAACRSLGLHQIRQIKAKTANITCIGPDRSFLIREQGLKARLLVTRPLSRRAFYILYKFRGRFRARLASGCRRLGN